MRLIWEEGAAVDMLDPTLSPSTADVMWSSTRISSSLAPFLGFLSPNPADQVTATFALFDLLPVIFLTLFFPPISIDPVASLTPECG